MEKWEAYFRKIVDVVLKNRKSLIDIKELESLSEAFIEISALIKPILITPRQIKSFGRHLLEKLNSPAITINFIDLFCLTVIETANPRLYSWISQNRFLFISPSSSPKEYFAIKHSIANVSGKEDPQKQQYDNFLNALAEIDFCKTDEKYIIEYIFFKEDFISKAKYIYINLPIKRRVTDNRFFCNYFYRDELPKIATQQGEFEFLQILQTEPFNIEGIIKCISNTNRRGLMMKKFEVVTRQCQ